MDNEKILKKHPPHIREVNLNLKKIIITLFSIEACLTLSDITCQLSRFIFGHDYLKGLVPFFDLSNELNLPAFFSSTLMLCIASLLAIICILNTRNRLPHKWKWRSLLFGFIYMAYDEAFSVHEKLTAPIVAILESPNLGLFHYAWTIPASILVFALTLYFYKFILSLSIEIRRLFLISGTTYLCGAIGFELIEGKYDELYGLNNLTYQLLVATEETLEMTGLILFIYSLSKYLLDTYGEIILSEGKP